MIFLKPVSAIAAVAVCHAIIIAACIYDGYKRRVYKRFDIAVRQIIFLCDLVKQKLRQHVYFFQTIHYAFL
jgi:hypothetical protein